MLYTVIYHLKKTPVSWDLTNESQAEQILFKMFFLLMFFVQRKVLLWAARWSPMIHFSSKTLVTQVYHSSPLFWQS